MMRPYSRKVPTIRSSLLLKSKKRKKKERSVLSLNDGEETTNVPPDPKHQEIHVDQRPAVEKPYGIATAVMLLCRKSMLLYLLSIMETAKFESGSRATLS